MSLSAPNDAACKAPPALGCLHRTTWRPHAGPANECAVRTSAGVAASLACFSRWSQPTSTLLAQGTYRSCKVSSCLIDLLTQVTTRKRALQVAREARMSAEEQLAAAKEEICQLSLQQQAYTACVADLEAALQVGPCTSGVPCL